MTDEMTPDTATDTATVAEPTITPEQTAQEPTQTTAPDETKSVASEPTTPTTPTTQEKPQIPPTSIFADLRAKENAAPQPSQLEGEDLTSYVDSAMDEDLFIGEDVAGGHIALTKDDARILAPYLHNAGLSGKQAASVMKCIQLYESAKLNVNNKRTIDAAASMRNDLTQTFGADLPRVAQNADRGGRLLFGEDEWEQLASVPELANRVGFLRGLARYAESRTNDPGIHGKPSQSAPPQDFFTRFTKASPR